MPWLTNVTEARFDELRFSRNVGRWPKPNTPRIGGFFRFELVEGFPYSIASRYFWQFKPFAGEETLLWAWLDLEQVSLGLLRGSTGPDSEGREVTLEVEQFIPPLQDPDTHAGGVTWRWFWTRPGFSTMRVSNTWPVNQTGFEIAPYTISLVPTNWFPWIGSIDHTVGAPRDWTQPFPIQNICFGQCPSATTLKGLRP